ncbi:unnamed protein product [Leuciscus chuanchicus]
MAYINLWDFELLNNIEHNHKVVSLDEPGIIETPVALITTIAEETADPVHFSPTSISIVVEDDVIVYQRLTDYVPMLKDAAKTLQHQMLELRNGADVVKLLNESSERGRRRADLKKRLERLTQAQELISNRL